MLAHIEYTQIYSIGPCIYFCTMFMYAKTSYDMYSNIHDYFLLAGTRKILKENNRFLAFIKRNNFILGSRRNVKLNMKFKIRITLLKLRIFYDLMPLILPYRKYSHQSLWMLYFLLFISYRSKNRNILQVQCVILLRTFFKEDIYRWLFPLNNPCKNAKKNDNKKLLLSDTSFVRGILKPKEQHGIKRMNIFSAEL